MVLFVQSFGIPVSSMSCLLVCLDKAVQVDSPAMEQAVVDKGYMAQLIEVRLAVNTLKQKPKNCVERRKEFRCLSREIWDICYDNF